MTCDDKIFEIATDLIRRSSMKHETWRATVIGQFHPSLPQPIELAEGELVLISASFPGDDWYIWTTRRLISSCDGSQYTMASEETAAADFGMFKGRPSLLNDPKAPLQTLVAAIQSHRGSVVRLTYELGYASMVPIQCHKYWTLKHQVLIDS